MAKIIYGIQSDGLGHYSRSKLVIDHLISSGHDVLVLTSGRAYDLMKNYYKVEKIEKINLVYKNNGIDFTKTIQEYLVKSASRIRNGNIKTKKIFEKFEPNLVISDMESFSAKTAISKKIPIIYIGNGYSLTHTNAPEIFDKKDKILKNISNLLNWQNPPNKYVKNYLITSFFNSKIKKGRKAKIIPSLIRNEIIKIKNSEIKDYIFVYQTTSTNKKLSKILNSVSSEKFIVYGFNKNQRNKNVQFKKTSIGKEFFEDIAKAKAIIANGGFSLMSEAIFLHKPFLSNPLKKQIEQKINAMQLEKLGYGKYVKKLTPDSIKSFLYDIEEYKKNLENYNQKDNSIAFEIIDEEIAKALKNKPIKKSFSRSSVSHNFSKPKKSLSKNLS